VRTTVTLEPDVAAAVEELRRHDHISQSDAVNRLARLGLGRRNGQDSLPRPFEPVSVDLGLLIDVSDTASALEYLEGPAYG
jgi:hypothetical protein